MNELIFILTVSGKALVLCLDSNMGRCMYPSTINDDSSKCGESFLLRDAMRFVR
jgi:hypothetical protein